MVNTSSCLFTVYLDPFCCCLSDNSFSGAIKETEICRPLPTFLNFTRRGQRTGSTKSCLPPHTNTATRQPSNWVDRYQSNRKPFHTPTHTHTHTHANIRTTTKGEIVPRYIPWVCLWVYILYVPWCEHYCDAPLRLFHLRSPLLIHAQACKHTHVNTHWHTHTHTHTQQCKTCCPAFLGAVQQACAAHSPASSATGQQSRLSPIGRPHTDPPTAWSLPGKLNKSAWGKLGAGSGRSARGGDVAVR